MKRMSNLIVPILALILATAGENSLAQESKSINKNERFQTVISKKQAIEDLDFFFSTLESVHPQLLANVSPDDYMGMKHKVKRWVEDNAGSISLSEFIIALTRSAAFFKDGHTQVHSILYLFDEKDPSRCMPPFSLQYRLGNVVITNTTKELSALSGQRLCKIDNVELGDFLIPLGKREQRTLCSSVHFQRMAWYLAWLEIKEPQVTITAQSNNGKIESYQVDLTTFQDYDRLFGKGNPIFQPSDFSFYRDNRICYYRYNRFMDSRDEKQKIDSMFASIKKYQTPNLIIDLRYNGGGSSDMIDYLMRYLTSKPYRMFLKYDTKISEPLIRQQENLERFKELIGLVITYPVEFTKPDSVDNRFDGKLFILTSPFTFSTAVGLALIIKDYELGTIIGEETGGLRESFGNVVPFSTPNYKIQFGVSNRKFYAAEPRIGDSEHGVIPDIVIDEKMLNKYRDERDPVLSFALDFIEKKT